MYMYLATVQVASNAHISDQFWFVHQIGKKSEGERERESGGAGREGGRQGRIRRGRGRGEGRGKEGKHGREAGKVDISRGLRHREVKGGRTHSIS